MRTVTLIVFTAIMFLGMAVGAQASIILLNPTSTFHESGNVNADASPGHAIGGVSGNIWNQIDTGLETSIVDDSGVSLSGVTVDIGVAGPSSTTLDYSVDPVFHDLGSQMNSGIYAGNAQSGIFTPTGKDGSKVGLAVSGLAAGQYTVYVTCLNANRNDAHSFDVFIGTSSTALSSGTDFSGFAVESVTNSSVNAADTWIAGVNYVALTVHLTTGEHLVVATENTGVTGGADENRGFLNTVEIVPVPEPASLLLIGMGVLLPTVRGRH